MKPLTAKELRGPLLELYREHEAAGMLPTSARFLFYELEGRGIISKETQARTDGVKGRRPEQNMIDALTQLRESGEIPWEDIIDETRALENYTGYVSVKDGVLAVLEQIQLDPWKGEPPIILVESRSLAGVLREIAREYRVLIASTNGQAGGFLRTSVGPALCPGQRVLYFGDLDFSGGHIEANTWRVLEKEVGDLEWERLALTQGQAKRYKLRPIRKFDKRDRKFHDAIETESLSQAVIVGILRDRLTELLPEPLGRVLERDQRQRSSLKKLLMKV